MQPTNTVNANPKPPSQKGAWMRTLSLGMVCVLGVVLVGFLKGITETAPTVRATSVAPEAALDRQDPEAQSYDSMSAISLGPNRDWQSELSRLQYERPGMFDPVVRMEDDKLAALADRARNRAYDGAPPVVPHLVQQQSTASCLACHREGLRLGDQLAGKMSHRYLSNCTQCHVESRSAVPVESDDLVENQFVGRRRSGPGQRALVGSPPTIPHATWMREDCTSCHGLAARPGIRTTHPWLSNCVQCHASSAELDQSPTQVAEHAAPHRASELRFPPAVNPTP